MLGAFSASKAQDAHQVSSGGRQGGARVGVVEKLATVQAYAQEDTESSKYGELLAVEGHLEWHVLFFHKVWTTTLHMLTASGSALALALAGSLAASGRFDPDLLLPFSQLAMGIGRDIGAIIFLSGDAAKLGDAVRRLRDVSERAPLIDGEAGAVIERDSPFLRGEMSLENVTFAYPSRSEQNVLDRCSLLQGGQAHRARRPSGCGKSTLNTPRALL